MSSAWWALTALRLSWSLLCGVVPHGPQALQLRLVQQRLLEEHVRRMLRKTLDVWEVVEQRIPDIRDRCDVVMEGTPLSHRHFLGVHKGSYGPALSAADGLFPGVTTPLEGFWMCGASTFPGIGIPPVAASGALAANGILGRKAQQELLESLSL